MTQCAEQQPSSHSAYIYITYESIHCNTSIIHDLGKETTEYLPLIIRGHTHKFSHCNEIPEVFNLEREKVTLFHGSGSSCPGMGHLTQCSGPWKRYHMAKVRRLWQAKLLTSLIRKQETGAREGNQGHIPPSRVNPQ